jgi:glucose-6-phosphate isomerase
MFHPLEKTGLPIDFNPCTYEISFSDLKDPLYGVRRLSAMAPVLEDPTCAGPDVMYWMYRNTGKKTCDHLLSQHHLRYDLSVYKHEMLGREFYKTSGHYHPNVPHTSVPYPEVYEVSKGVATYVLQKVDDYRACPHEVKVLDFIVLRCEAGEKAIMPPDYGHITINATGKPMVTTNWVCSEFQSYYISTELCHGFAYYLVEENGKPTWVPNPHYKCELPPIRFARCKDVPELGLVKDQPIYTACEQNPDLFRYVSRPVGYEDLM